MVVDQEAGNGGVKMIRNDEKQNDLRLVTVKALPHEPGYEWLSEPAIRHLIFDARERINSKGEVIPGNGLKSSLVRVGRKVLIDLDQFSVWLESQREENIEY